MDETYLRKQFCNKFKSINNVNACVNFVACNLHIAKARIKCMHFGEYIFSKELSKQYDCKA